MVALIVGCGVLGGVLYLAYCDVACLLPRRLDEVTAEPSLTILAGATLGGAMAPLLIAYLAG